MEIQYTELIQTHKAPPMTIDAAGQHLVPLWEVMRGLLPREPTPAARAHLWRYHELRPA